MDASRASRPRRASASSPPRRSASRRRATSARAWWRWPNARASRARPLSALPHQGGAARRAQRERDRRVARALGAHAHGRRARARGDREAGSARGSRARRSSRRVRIVTADETQQALLLDRAATEQALAHTLRMLTAVLRRGVRSGELAPELDVSACRAEPPGAADGPLAQSRLGAPARGCARRAPPRRDLSLVRRGLAR